MKEGRVYLIGAGPGDPGLITVKGLECIKKADTVVYDRLANPSLLSYKKPGAELIYVGKLPHRHTLSQEEINELLVTQGQKGCVVARLKGGDPFVFGRGGEEAEHLRQAGVAFEVVPGVTSCIAVPAYAGIPVTHRGLASTFTVITGHEDPGKTGSYIDWSRLALDPGTLIFLMGVENLPEITANLQEKCKSASTPTAVIRWGTRPEQEVVTGTLEDIGEKVRAAGLTSPAVIIVGDVVSLRQKLEWFEKLPFFGRRILVTRARRQASILSRRIADLGGEALEFPTIKIEPPLDLEPLDQAVRWAATYDWIVFTSVNGVDYFFQRLKKLKIDIRNLGKARICAIGPQTREALEEMGLVVDFIPEKYRTEEILEGLKEKLVIGQRVLLPKAELARPLLAQGLLAFGIQVDEVTAYRTVQDDQDSTILLEKIRQGQIQAVTFTSSSTVKNFAALFPTGEPFIPENIVVACIGPVTADTALTLGLRVDVVAREYTIEGLVQALVEHFASKGGRNK